ncbi:MAG: energy transducer TonB [Flavobacteriales bacterium]
MKHDSDILKRIKSYFMRRKSADEAYKFEREIERDAFLYEAMEGFEDMLTSDIQQAMDELDDRLDAKSHGGLLAINWKMAASVAAVIGIAGLLIMLVFNGDKVAETDVASEPQEEDRYIPRSEQTNFDSLGDYSWAMATDSTPRDSSVLVEDAAYVHDENVSHSASVPAPPTEQKLMTPEPAPKKEAINESTDGETTDVIFDDQSQEIAFTADESVEPMQPQAMKSLALEANAKSRSANEQPSALEETSSITQKTVQPKGGMAAYKSYLKKNIQTSEGMPKGTVTVTFELDRNGKPKKLEVSNSLCTACDAEAKRLVENGPEWEPVDKKERLSVTVEFP